VIEERVRKTRLEHGLEIVATMDDMAGSNEYTNEESISRNVCASFTQLT